MRRMKPPTFPVPAPPPDLRAPDERVPTGHDGKRTATRADLAALTFHDAPLAPLDPADWGSLHMPVRWS